MAKTVESKEVEEIRKALDDGRIVIGTDRTLKELKKGAISKVFVSSNCPNDVKDDLDHYCPLSSVELVQMPIPNDEMGIVCKKPFAVSILGLKK